MNDNPRARRMAERIKVIVAEYLDTRIKDERKGMVTITDVRVTGDLQQAAIFYTVYGDDEARAATAAALSSAKGRIRSEVGRQIGTRLTPSIEFHLDTVPETSAHLTAALAEAARRDAELAALREGKAYAGDANPYKEAEDEMSEEMTTAVPEVPEAAGFDGYDDAGEDKVFPDRGYQLEDHGEKGGFAGFDDVNE
ncbi:MAG: 30S ribosome-binding factor RbfA [Promicromonosporaceae bacterium]|nr:30S ribosome-binding factor RbfA [Promicromonosporaceae bacterium]